MSDDIAAALNVARALVAAGMPVFLARPDPASRTGYSLPPGWEKATADPRVIDAWQPGWGLAAVTGHVLDLVDVDPRSGGEVGPWLPRAYAVAETPSGGRHYFAAPLGVSSRDGVYPGVDLKSGTPEGVGRGFAFISPTVRTSKVDGIARPYRWVELGVPTREGSAADRSGESLRARVAELRTTAAPSGAARTIPRSVARREFDNAVTRLTERVAHWARFGWGGEAHAELLAASTHLARLAPEHAEGAFVLAFQRAGVEPDWADLSKLHSAIESAVPDVVLPDAEFTASDLFFAGGDAAPDTPPGSVSTGTAALIPTQPSDPSAFDFVGAERARRREPPAAAVYGAFGGGTPLVYADGVHWLQGESESGKSWVAIAVALDVLRSGAPVIYVDYEDDEGAVLGRFEALGATDDDFDRLVYVSGLDVSHADVVSHLRASVGTRDYGLLVVDGVTAGMSAAGLSGRDEQEVTTWSDRLLRITRSALVVDHVVKAVDERAGMAIGSQAKKSVVTGTAFEVVCVEKFARGVNGVIELRIQKDKKGGVRSALKGRAKVRLRFVSDFATGAVTLAVPDAVSADVDPSQALADLHARGDTVRALVTALESYPAAHAEHSQRHLLGLLREEMNQQGRTDDMRDAVRVFKARAGIGGVIVPDWFREYEADVRTLVPKIPHEVTIGSQRAGAA